MSALLDEMAAASWDRVRAARARQPLAALRAVADAAPPVPPLPLDGPLLIAEIKFVAPSVGRLAAPPSDRRATVASRARHYAAAGAAAISVLTEPQRFGGELTDLAVAAAASPRPAMRKDFLVDPYQVLEARAAGAGGVLLIARMLSDAQLRELADAASELGMFTLIEAFDEEELGRAITLSRAPSGPPRLAGVNTRDLKTLAVDPHRLRDLAALIPEDVPVIAESGMSTPADVRAAVSLGYRGALVGTALMRAPDPGALLAEMVAACG